MDDALAKAEYAVKFSGSVFSALSKQFCVLDNAGYVLSVNQAWQDFDCAFNGAVQTLEIGQNFLTHLNTGLGELRGGEAFAKGVQSVLNTTKSSFSLEYSCQVFAVQQWFTGKVIAFPEQGQGGVVVVYENISEYKRLEHRFRQAVESAPNAIVMINELGIILMVNLQTESAFGYSRSELVGQPVEILVPKRFRGAHVGYRDAYLAAPASRPMGAGRDLYGLRKDGTEFPVEIGLDHH